MKREESLQMAVSNYLRLQYPDIIFTSESSGIRLTIGQAVKAKRLRSSKGLPDLIILEPKKKYSGLCLELKSKSPLKKNGAFRKSEHLENQREILKNLTMKGYCAVFATGFDEAKEIIDNYLN